MKLPPHPQRDHLILLAATVEADGKIWRDRMDAWLDCLKAPKHD